MLLQVALELSRNAVQLARGELEQRCCIPVSEVARWVVLPHREVIQVVDEEDGDPAQVGEHALHDPLGTLEVDSVELQGVVFQLSLECLLGELLAVQDRRDGFFELEGELVAVSGEVEHVMLERFLRAESVVLAGDVRVEVPQLLGLLDNGCFDFVDFVIDFGSQLLKKRTNLIFESCVAAVGLGGDLLDLLEESRVVGERPVPENRVCVASLDLLDQ